MCQPDDIHPALPGREDPAGLWTTRLAPRGRQALAAAFETDRDLRAEIEALLGGLEHGLRGVFVRELAQALISPPAPGAPAGAVLVALGATLAYRDPLL